MNVYSNLEESFYGYLTEGSPLEDGARDAIVSHDNEYKARLIFEKALNSPAASEKKIYKRAALLPFKLLTNYRFFEMISRGIVVEPQEFIYGSCYLSDKGLSLMISYLSRKKPQYKPFFESIRVTNLYERKSFFEECASMASGSLTALFFETTNHWSLISMNKFKKIEMFFFDSLGYIESETQAFAKEYFRSKEQNFQFYTSGLPQQTDGCTCATFCFQYALEIHKMGASFFQNLVSEHGKVDELPPRLCKGDQVRKVIPRSLTEIVNKRGETLLDLNKRHGVETGKNRYMHDKHVKNIQRITLEILRGS